MSGGENEDEASTNVKKSEAEPGLSHPNYKFDYKLRRYRHGNTGQFASREDVEKAIQADKMSDNYHKIRLPTWNPTEPQLWFVECEDLFTLAKVKDEDQKTKAILARRELPAEVKNNIKDFILKPTPETEYDDLKEAVIAQRPAQAVARGSIHRNREHDPGEPKAVHPRAGNTSHHPRQMRLRQNQ